MADELILTVNPARVSVEPGGTAGIALQVQNRGSVVDEFVIEVLGDAAAWTSVDPSRVPIFPGGTESVHVSLRPPRASHPEAGTMPVGFRVHSTVDPALSVVEECRVVLEPFTEIGCEIAPRTARGRFSATHRLRVINRGNAPVSVSVRAEVHQGDCEISVPPAPLALAAGQRVDTRIRVRPTRSHWQGGDEMHQYRLNLEPLGGGTPFALDATMRQPPIARIPTALLVAVALLIGGAYIAYGRGSNPVQIGQAPAPSPSTSTLPTATVTTPLAVTPSPQVCQQIVPGPPTGVTATAGDTKATLSWTAATSSCGLPITSYTVTLSPGIPSVAVAGAVTTATIQNLADRTAYTVTVTAANSVGNGPTSSPITVTPMCAALALDSFMAQVAPGTYPPVVDLRWTASGGCGPFTGAITANYVGQAVYKKYPITSEQGALRDAPPPQNACPTGTLTVVYTLTLKDTFNQTITLVQKANVFWGCIM